jgi:hypothetical protein
MDNLRGLDRLVHRLASANPDRPIGLRGLAEAMPELGVPSERPPGSPSQFPVTDTAPPQPPDPDPARRRPTREEFLNVYTASGFSVRATSKHFAKDRRQIYRWLESFGIDREPED